MIPIGSFWGECLIRQKRDFGRKLGKLLEHAVELIGGELLGRAGMHRLFERRCCVVLADIGLSESSGPYDARR